MIYTDLSPLENRLWQSSLCVAGVWLLTFLLKQNRATLKYRLWLAASAKFLVPFSLLVSIGGHLGWRSAPPNGQPQWTFVMEDLGRSFAMPAHPTHHAAALPSSHLIPAMLFFVWVSGIAVNILLLVRCFMKITVPVLWLIAAIVSSVVVFMGQKKWGGVDAESSLIKALIVGFLVALPTPFPSFLTVPSAIVGTVQMMRRKEQ